MWPREQLVETDVKDTVMLNLTIVTAVIILTIVIFIEELVTLTLLSLISSTQSW